MALDKDKITLSVTSPENGTAAEEVPGDYTSLAFEIGFNSRYLLDILGQLEGDLIEVHLADAAAEISTLSRVASACAAAALARSEEHTSELQSLMRISYAVFCLKKKNIHTIHT